MDSIDPRSILKSNKFVVDVANGTMGNGFNGPKVNSKFVADVANGTMGNYDSIDLKITQNKKSLTNLNIVAYALFVR